MSAQSSAEFELEEPPLEWRAPKEYWEQIKAAEAIVRMNASCELVPNSGEVRGGDNGSLRRDGVGFSLAGVEVSRTA